MIQNNEGIERWDDKRDLVFSHMCLVGRMEKWRNRKLIYLVGEKKWEDEKWNWYKLTYMFLLKKLCSIKKKINKQSTKKKKISPSLLKQKSCPIKK